MFFEKLGNWKCYVCMHVNQKLKTEAWYISLFALTKWVGHSTRWHVVCVALYLGGVCLIPSHFHHHYISCERWVWPGSYLRISWHLIVQSLTVYWMFCPAHRVQLWGTIVPRVLCQWQWYAEMKAQFVCYFMPLQSDVHLSKDHLACVVKAVINQYPDCICLSVMLQNWDTGANHFKSL